MTLSFVFRKMLRLFLNPPTINGSKIDKTSVIRNGCSVSGSNIGKYTYLSEYTTVSYANIGAFCSIASFCTIGSAAHPIDWASSSPVFTKGRNPLCKNFSKIPFDTHSTTEIGNDVWIGTHALIKSGVHIADGAIIGMGSVVTHDVGPYEIWAGIPARFIRKRHLDEHIEKLLNIKWWEMSEENIKTLAPYMNDIEEFLGKATEIIDK